MPRMPRSLGEPGNAGTRKLCLLFPFLTNHMPVERKLSPASRERQTRFIASLQERSLATRIFAKSPEPPRQAIAIYFESEKPEIYKERSHG
ncbi:MAG: hypothetical protein KME26_01320 [Oscillatoria princeps RMCB-10]|nr:hypothetical protein [Oscillatoria princeps RMCB-10]